MSDLPGITAESRPIEFWSKRGALGAKKSQAIMRARIHATATCPNCGREYTEWGLAGHRSKCKGRPAASEPKTRGHSKCGCGRVKRTDALRCFRCAGWDSAELAARLGGVGV